MSLTFPTCRTPFTFIAFLTDPEPFSNILLHIGQPAPPVLRENCIRLDSRGVLNRSEQDVRPSNRFLRDQLATTRETWFLFGVRTRRQEMISDDRTRLGTSR
jgi:hypothetical protein